MRSATAIVGLVSPRSTCESIWAETPLRSARSRRERFIPSRRSLIRPPTAGTLLATLMPCTLSRTLVRATSGGRRGVLLVGEASSQDLLVELAHGRLRHLVDELDAVRQLSLRYAGLQVLEDGVRVQIAPLSLHHTRARALAPALVGDRDHGGLEHVGVGHDLVLALHRGDPLAARLH